MDYHFRKVHGGWVMQYGCDEDADDEVFSSGIALLHKLNEVISLHDAQDSASGAASKAIEDKVRENQKKLKID